jgi:hypothetical protein
MERQIVVSAEPGRMPADRAIPSPLEVPRILA